VGLLNRLLFLEPSFLPLKYLVVGLIIFLLFSLLPGVISVPTTTGVCDFCVCEEKGRGFNFRTAAGVGCKMWVAKNRSHHPNEKVGD
jgi:hypothetical protein